MTQEEETPHGLPEERFIVRVFALADHAEAVAQTGKFYINGLGVGSVFMNTLPGPLPSLHIVIRLAVPWQQTTEPFTVRIRALNADRTPVNRDPLFEVPAEVGRPPGYRIGDEAAINLDVGITGMPIQAPGTIYFHLEVNGESLAVHPLKIMSLPDLRSTLLGQ